MFEFFKKSKLDPSKVRQWANADYLKKEKTKMKNIPAVQMLSDSLLWGVTRFGNPDKTCDEDLTYASDLALFEWSCFVYYRIGCWHQDHKVRKDQDDVFRFLLHQMIEKFETLAGFMNAKDILSNRFDLYESLEEKGETDATIFHLEQLIQKSTAEGVVTLHSENEPVLIGGIFQTVELQIMLSTQVQAMLPRLMKNIETFYQMIK